ncbi:MAG TPA: NADH-quinone oxidoreductase subunit J [Polyangiaceae bacterium]
MTVGNVFFLVASIVALVGAVMTIASRSPIRSAVGLLITIVGIAALFLMLNAQFLAAIQLIVYAGAVVVLFVFVIMLLGPDAGDGEGTVARARLARYGAGAFFLALSLGAAHLVSRADLAAHRFKVAPAAHGSVEGIGTLLFGSMVIPCELATALLIVAVVGAIAVARGKPHVRRESKSASPTARMFHGPLMARDAQRPLPTKAERAAKAAGGV